MKTALQVPDWVRPFRDHPDYELLHARMQGKYVYDRVFACLILLMIWPFFVVAALLIKLDGLLHPENKGSVFYREPRITEGRLFYIIKFRTVPEEKVFWIKEKPESRSITGAGDPTWAGRIILNWYADEMAQLINIAKGDMVFVGLRPHVLEHTEDELKKNFPYRMLIKCGLFGLPQACKKDPTYQKILERMARLHKPLQAILFKLDGLYIENCKKRNPLTLFFFDVWVTLRCFLVIFRGGGS